jgi:hypothetical protein
VQLQNELEKQRRATEFALRKRTHTEEQSRQELEWQLKIVSDANTLTRDQKIHSRVFLVEFWIKKKRESCANCHSCQV